jgi:hypothetical protein
MAGQDASNELESREQVVDARTLRLSSVSPPRFGPDATMLTGDSACSQLVEERIQLARQVFALSTMSSVTSPLQPVEAINEDKFQTWIGGFPMNSYVFPPEIGTIRLMSFSVRSSCQWRRLIGT